MENSKVSKDTLEFQTRIQKTEERETRTLSSGETGHMRKQINTGDKEEDIR